MEWNDLHVGPMQFLEVCDIAIVKLYKMSVPAVDLVKASHDLSFYHTMEVFHILLSVTSET